MLPRRLKSTDKKRMLLLAASLACWHLDCPSPASLHRVCPRHCTESFCHRCDYICRNKVNRILFVLVLFLHCFVISGGNVSVVPDVLHCFVISGGNVSVVPGVLYIFFPLSVQSLRNNSCNSIFRCMACHNSKMHVHCMTQCTRHLAFV